MIEAITSGLSAVLNLYTLGIIFIGVLIGLAVGILPGIGGMTTVAIMLPFIYKWDPRVSLSLVIAIYAATYSSGLVTSILLGIPGEANATATLLDGHPMTKRGEGGRALGAGFMASLLGGIFGSIVLALLIPVARPIVLAITSPELFALAMVGVSFIAILSSTHKIRGLVMGLLGILAAGVGIFPFTGTPRFTFGTFYLQDGVPLVAVCVGIFAIPELMEMTVSGGIAEKNKRIDLGEVAHGVLTGIKDCFRHWRTVLSGSALGSALGFIPGVGVVTATFLSYGLARMLSKRPEDFGTGCVEGVIAPESADNAKEGSGLLTTLAFGLPGGVSMAMVLVILMMAGIAPGSEIMIKHLDVVWSLVVALVVSNILAAAIGMATAKYLAKIVCLRVGFLVPIILLLVVVASFGLNSRIEDVAMAFIWGGIGYLMKEFNYSRVTFIVGFVLGDLVERYFLLSVGTIGWDFLIKRPAALVILFFILPLLGQQWIRRLFKRSDREGGPAQ
ncbi:MAG: tripartite tricarboxylate transporter permease [Thermodesulfobacteriota bacterium]